MKKKKNHIRKRIFSVLLTAALATGIVSNSVPARVFARESVSGNDVKGTETGGWSTFFNMDDVIGGDCSKSGDDSLLWTFDSVSGTLNITGSGEMKDNAGLPAVNCWYDYKDSIKTVVISDAASIGSFAFANCTNLESVTIPGSVQEIGYGAFQDCSNLDNVTIPSGVQEIDMDAFKNCSSLKNLTISEGVQKIGRYMFYNCTSLESVTIPSSVQEIEDYAFENCTSLESVTISDGVQTIGDRAFFGCSALTSITMPSSVTKIDSSVFQQCNRLEKVFFLSRDVIPEVDASAFFTTPCVTGDAKGLIVPLGMVDAYKRKFGAVLEPHITDGTYTVNVTNGTVSGGASEANYEPGVPVTITAANPPSGKAFDTWVVDSGNVNLAAYDSVTTTFTMPEGAVTVTAMYKRESIPEKGTVTPEVQPGNNAPTADISTPAEELQELLLTEDEKLQVQGGTDIRIILEIQDAGNTVNASDEESTEQALNGFSVGQYLDIDLYMLVGQNRRDITETQRKIKIVITVPEGLRNTDSDRTRTFAVIRVHNGVAELLSDVDDSADTISIETDRFSSYAIVYKDTAGNDTGNDNGNSNGSTDSGGNNADSGTKTGSAKDNEPKTGDYTPIELYATFPMIAGFAYLLLYFSDHGRGMSEETKKELVAGIVAWAKRGGKVRRYFALAAILALLVYYHSIGRKMCVKWKEIYGE